MPGIVSIVSRRPVLLHTAARALPRILALAIGLSASPVSASLDQWHPVGPTGVGMVTTIAAGRTAVYAATCNGVYRSERSQHRTDHRTVDLGAERDLQIGFLERAPQLVFVPRLPVAAGDRLVHADQPRGVGQVEQPDLHTIAFFVHRGRRGGRSLRRVKPGGRLLVSVFTPETDLTGRGIRSVAGEPDVYEGFDSGGRHVLVDAAGLDREIARFGLLPLEPARTARPKVETGRRVSANGAIPEDSLTPTRWARG